MMTKRKTRVVSVRAVAIVGLACLILTGLAQAQSAMSAFGNNASGQCNVPALPGPLNYVEVAAGGYHTVARRSNGSVVAWGRNVRGRLECQ